MNNEFLELRKNNFGSVVIIMRIILLSKVWVKFWYGSSNGKLKKKSFGKTNL